jgi:hypothetical protein
MDRLGRDVRKIVATLRAWFGIEEAVGDYVVVADQSPTVIASLGGEDVGLMTIRRHNPYAAGSTSWPACPSITAAA